MRVEPRRMYCPNCGTESDESAKFCGNCGKALPSTGEQVAPSNVDTFDTARGRAGDVPAVPAASDGAVPHIPNYLVQAILVTIFCCLPAGIVSIVYAAQVNGKVAAGDIAGARAASQNAKTWAWISFGVSLGLGVLWFLAVFVGGLGEILGDEILGEMLGTL